MCLRGIGLVASLHVLVACFPASGQRRVDVTPLFGYRSPISITAADENGQTVGKAHLSSGSSIGIAVGVRYEETAVIEFRWTRQNTETRISAPGAALPSPFDTRLEQYHGDFTREFILEEARMVRPFIIGSAGMTRFSWPGRSSSRFSFGIGGGVKFFPVKWMGFRIQAQWLPVWVNPEVKAFACGGGCLVVLGGKLADQGEVSFGPVFSF